MTQEQKELLLKDICARLPYGVKTQIKNEIVVLDSICDDDGYHFNFIGDDREGVNIENIKPYLFPLSSITEEQTEKLKGLCNMFNPDYYYPYAYWGIEVLYRHIHDDNYKFGFKTDIIDWLLKNHFDIYGLIPMGLAKDATGLSIY